MIVVMQCAGTKRPDARSLETHDGRPVQFVGAPELAPRSQTHVFAHPDGRADDGRTWRDHLVDYNTAGDNPLGLSKAVELYEPPAAPDVYRRLVGWLGTENVFVLSAGWGLIRADFFTPAYDITFAPEAKRKAPWKHRSKDDAYNDFCQLVEARGKEIVFVGGQSYIRSFCALTNHLDAPRTVFFNSRIPPRAPGCELRRFEEATRNMNWQYDCARWLLQQL